MVAVVIDSLMLLQIHVVKVFVDPVDVCPDNIPFGFAFDFLPAPVLHDLVHGVAQESSESDERAAFEIGNIRMGQIGKNLWSIVFFLMCG